jgi:hypothetical protein
VSQTGQTWSLDACLVSKFGHYDADLKTEGLAKDFDSMVEKSISKLNLNTLKRENVIKMK